MTLVLFHTAQSNVDLFDQLLGEHQFAQVHRMLRDDLLSAAEAAGEFGGDLRAETAAAMRQALEEGGPDARLLCTCSTIGPAADDLAADGLPVTRVDRALAEAAFDRGTRIAVLYAVETTREPTRALFQDVSDARGLTATIDLIPVPGAWEQFKAGNMEAYFRTIADAIDTLPDDYDAIALAQASMAPAASLTDRPVLTSPQAGLAALAI